MGRSLAVAMLLGLLGQAAAEEPRAPALEIRNARTPLEGILTGGQPTPEQFEQAAAAGYRTIVNLRTAGEPGFDWEADLVRELGMRYELIEVAGAAGLTRENVERLAEVLAEPDALPAMVHCASGNRVGALLALKAAWLDGVPEDVALRLGLDAGLTRLEANTRELLARNGPGSLTLYASNVAAAGALLRLGETGEALRWLESAPERHRRWEWGYLAARADQSAATLRGHEGSVHAVAFSPDGSRLASAGSDGTVRLWDRTGEEAAVLRGHEAEVLSVAFSPDGERLASASRDTTIRLWDPATGELRRTLEGHTRVVGCVAFDGDGRRLASTSYRIREQGGTLGLVKVWDVATGTEVVELPSDTYAPVTTVAFVPGTPYLLGGSWDQSIKRWNLESPGEPEARTLRPEKYYRAVNSVARAPDGSWFASAAKDGSLRIWDTGTLEQRLHLRAHEQPVWSVAVSPDGARVASASVDGSVRIWNAANGELLLTLQGHTGAVRSVAFDPRGRRLASASLDGTVRLWDLDSLERLDRPRDYGEASVWGSTFSPDGRLLILGLSDGRVQVLDAATLESRREFRGCEDWVNEIALDRDGGRLATTCSDGIVRLWSTRNWSEIGRLERHDRPVISVAFSPDGGRAVSGGRDRTVRIWDTNSGKLRHTLTGHEGNVETVDWSPRGDRVASGSADGTVRLWDPETGAAVAVLEGHGGNVFRVAFDPGGTVLASGGGDHAIRLWNAATGEPLRVLEGHEENVDVLAFHPDGERLLSGSGDLTLRVWDPDSGRPLLTVPGFRGIVWTLAFSHDGTRLAVGTLGAPLHLLDSVPLRRRLEAARDSSAAAAGAAR